MRKLIALRLFHNDLNIIYQNFLIESIKCYFTKLGTVTPSIESIRLLREVGVLLRYFPQCRLDPEAGYESSQSGHSHGTFKNH